MHPPERDEATGLTFAWTGADVALRLPGLDRRRALDARRYASAARGRTPAQSRSSCFVDGVHPGDRPDADGLRGHAVTIPARGRATRPDARAPQSRGRSFRVPTIRAPLGVMLDRLTLTPDGLVLPPRPAPLRRAPSAAALGAAIALLGVTAGLARSAPRSCSAPVQPRSWHAASVRSRLPGHGHALGCWIALGARAARRWRSSAGAAGRSGTPRGSRSRSRPRALFLKLLVLLHPNMPIGDALFHAHRFQACSHGNLLLHVDRAGQLPVPLCAGPLRRRAAVRRLVARGRRHGAAARHHRAGRRGRRRSFSIWWSSRGWGESARRPRGGRRLSSHSAGLRDRHRPAT